MPPEPSASPASPSPEGARPAPPRRSAGRIGGGIVLLLLALGLLCIGVDAITDPSAVVADAASTGRNADSEAEARLGGVLMCGFGIAVGCFGIGLLKRKRAPGEK